MPPADAYAKRASAPEILKCVWYSWMNSQISNQQLILPGPVMVQVNDPILCFALTIL
jgi:hypothetical protein